MNINATLYRFAVTEENVIGQLLRSGDVKQASNLANSVLSMMSSEYGNKVKLHDKITVNRTTKNRGKYLEYSMVKWHIFHGMETF